MIENSKGSIFLIENS